MATASRPSPSPAEGDSSPERREERESPAAWRVLPGEPQTAWGWVFGVPSRVRLGLLAALVVAILGAGAWTRFPLWAFVPIVVTVVPMAAYFGAWSRRAYAALPTHTDRPTSLPVAVVVFRAGRALGRDYGWIDFAEGWLVYQGLRADFSLRASDVVSRLVSERSVDLFLADGRRLRIRSIPVPTGGSRPNRDEGYIQVANAFRAWFRGPLAEGESRFPPVSRHPAITAAFLRLLFLCVPVLVVFGLGGVAVGNAWLALGPLLVAAVLLAVCARGLASLRRALTLTERPSASAPNRGLHASRPHP